MTNKKEEVKAVASTTDLSSLDTSKIADEGAKLHLRHPVTDKPLYVDGDSLRPITITLLGADGDRFNESRREIIDQRLAKAQDQRRPDLRLAEDAAIEHLASITVDFENIFLDGKPVNFSTANARKLYERLKWVREQVERFVHNRANFLPA